MSVYIYVVLIIYNIESTLTTHTDGTKEVNSKEKVIIYNILPYDNNFYPYLNPLIK